MQFDFIAKYYPFLSKLVFGKTLEIVKISLFDHINDGSRVLIIGGGAGVSLKKLLKVKKQLNIDFVDASNQMVLKAKHLIGANESVNFEVCPIEEFKGTNYDLIITEFFFDLFAKEKLIQLVPRIGSKLNNNGNWVDTDFRRPVKKYHHFLLSIMYLFFKITAQIEADALTDVGVIMENNGLSKQEEKVFKSGFVSSRLFELS